MSIADQVRQTAAPSPRPRRAPQICILALSPISDDPRVRRQGEAFYAAGWDVAAVGLPGGRSANPVWPILTREDPAGPAAAPAVVPPNQPLTHSFRLALRNRLRPAVRLLISDRRRRQQLSSVLGRALSHLRGIAGHFFRVARRCVQHARRAAAIARRFAARFSPSLAERLYWQLFTDTAAIYETARRLRAGIWLANDWNMLPVAARLARENGGIYVYDSHEFATEEYGNWKWRFWQRPVVRQVERRYIKNAAIISAVSGGIADGLGRMYHPARPPLVIRNMPQYQKACFRPTGQRIRVLYHGIIAPGRGLEAAIDSVASWRPEFDLTIRGPENPVLSDALRRRIAAQGLADRVQLVPPVPMTELVEAAMPFDVGFFAFPSDCWQNEFVLPNKFFEYIMAGLALCVSDLPEMARLLRERDLGVLIRQLDPGAITAAINSLDRPTIDRYKRNSLRAAEELCWERDAARLVAAYEAALGAAADCGGAAFESAAIGTMRGAI